MNDRGGFPKESGKFALQGVMNHKGDFLNLLKHANYPLKIDVPSETTQHGTDIEIATQYRLSSLYVTETGS